MGDSSQVLKERKREHSKKSHKEYLDNKYRNRILMKQSSKSRLNDSVYEEKNHHSKSRLEEYEQSKKQTHADKEK